MDCYRILVAVFYPRSALIAPQIQYIKVRKFLCHAFSEPFRAFRVNKTPVHHKAYHPPYL